MTRRVAVIGGAASPNGKLQTVADARCRRSSTRSWRRWRSTRWRPPGLPKEEIGALVFAMCALHAAEIFARSSPTVAPALEGTVSMEVLGQRHDGGLAFDEAVNAVAVGRADVALALGINMESQADSAEHMMSTMRGSGDVNFHGVFGFTPISWYAMDAVRYMHEYRRNPGGADERRRQGPAARRARSDRPVPQAADAGGVCPGPPGPSSSRSASTKVNRAARRTEPSAWSCAPRRSPRQRRRPYAPGTQPRTS